jgi:hypothetical protein
MWFDEHDASRRSSRRCRYADLEEIMKGWVMVRLWFVLVLGLLVPSTIFAQAGSTGSIVGVARDGTGGVVPGVTVEVSSPALIDKTRVGVTSSDGQYQILSLPPGEYSVTFTLPGFSTVKQEGIKLVGGFTATINAALAVGSVQETITVSAEAPLVDTRSTTQLRTVERELIETLPAPKNFSAQAGLIPGVSVNSFSGRDVGGNTGEMIPRPTIHGSQDAMLLFDGMRPTDIGAAGGSGAGPWVANAGMIEQFSIETGGSTAEWETSGVRVNPIPKSGGNRFSGYFHVAYMNKDMQWDNLDDALRARGVTLPVKTHKIYDVNPAMGGPIKKDKLWFYAAWRSWGTEFAPPGAFHAVDPAAPIFVKDLSRPYTSSNGYYSTAGRLTWQPAQKHGFTFYADHVPANWKREFSRGPQDSAEATPNHRVRINSLVQGTWKWTRSSNWLVEVGESYRYGDWAHVPQDSAVPGLSRVIEATTGFATRQPGFAIAGLMKSHNGRGAVTYVSGGHSLKVGTQWMQGSGQYVNTIPNDSVYTLFGGVPISVTLRTSPLDARHNLKMNMGLYVTDQWAYKRLTLNTGLRYDWFNSYIPNYTRPATRYAPALEIRRQDNLPNYKDVSPRFGASYDLFGDGRTALKAGFGRYLELNGTQVVDRVHPQAAIGGNVVLTSDTRTWTDRNGDFVAQDDELGPSSNVNFGTDRVAIRYAPGTVDGWGVRPFSWETMVGIEHQLFSFASVGVSYHRRVGRNYFVTRNLAVNPSDFDPFCVTVPVDPRLPGGGGGEFCGLYNISPAKFGLNDSLIQPDRAFGKTTDTFDGVDVNVGARLPRSITLQGGFSTGRAPTTYNGGGTGNVTGSAVKRCFVVDSPQELLHCDLKTPFLTDVKFLAAYPLPWWGLETSITVQSSPGSQILASYAAPASAVTGLGRPLAGGARTVTVPLIQPGTVYSDRVNQVDVRFGKSVLVGGTRLRGNIDLYNLFNSNTVTGLVGNYGPAWLFPFQFLSGRIAKVGFTATF